MMQIKESIFFGWKLSLGFKSQFGQEKGSNEISGSPLILSFTWRTKEFSPMAYSLSALILRLRHLLMFSNNLSSASILMRMASWDNDPWRALEKPITKRKMGLALAWWNIAKQPLTLTPKSKVTKTLYLRSEKCSIKCQLLERLVYFGKRSLGSKPFITSLIRQ